MAPVRAVDREAVDHALESVALTELRRRRIGELSGGQQQRALIAKALAAEPELLVLDEPIAGVDVESQRLFRDSLVHLVREHGAAVLLVSHELGAVADDLDHVVVLKRRVVFDGAPADLGGDRSEPRRPPRRPAAVARGHRHRRAAGGERRLMPGMPWALPWPFDREYMQLALLAGVVVGATAPLIGVFIVQQRHVAHGRRPSVTSRSRASARACCSARRRRGPRSSSSIGAALVIEFLRTRGSCLG